MPVPAGKNGREPYDGTSRLRDENTAVLDLPKRKLDSFWIGQERFPVSRIAE
jgi:hypothetical protein